MNERRPRRNAASTKRTRASSSLRVSVERWVFTETGRGDAAATTWILCGDGSPAGARSRTRLWSRRGPTTRPRRPTPLKRTATRSPGSPAPWARRTPRPPRNARSTRRAEPERRLDGSRDVLRGDDDVRARRRRRGRDVDIPRRGVAAPPRPRRGYSAERSRGDAAAATWIFRGEESRRRRGRHVDISLMNRGDAAEGPRRVSSRRLVATPDPRRPWARARPPSRATAPRRRRRRRITSSSRRRAAREPSALPTGASGRVAAPPRGATWTFRGCQKRTKIDGSRGRDPRGATRTF